MTHLTREGYKVVMDDKTLKNARLSEDDRGLIFTFHSWASSFQKRGQKNAKEDDFVLRKEFEVLFETPAERIQFTRLVQYYVLKYSFEKHLYNNDGKQRLRNIYISKSEQEIVDQTLKHFPIPLVTPFLHQMWVEFMTRQGWCVGPFSIDNKTDENLVNFDSLPILKRSSAKNILKKIFKYMVHLGFDFKYIPNKITHSEMANDYWVVGENPELTMIDHKSGIFGFLPILAEHFHDLWSYVQLQDGYEVYDLFSEGQTNILPFLEPWNCIEDEEYKNFRINQIIVILKFLQLNGFDIDFKFI